MTCSKNHTNVTEKFEVLEDSQASAWRHKCAGCAYDLGFQDGQENTKKLLLEAVISFLKNL